MLMEQMMVIMTMVMVVMVMKQMKLQMTPMRVVSWWNFADGGGFRVGEKKMVM